MRIVHISDPHLSTLADIDLRTLHGKRLLGYQSWYRRRRHQHRKDVLDELTQAVTDESPDLVIVTGDLVHIGLASELIEARAWLERLGGPDTVLLVPGNHDCYQPDSWAWVKHHLHPYLDIGESAASPSDPFPVLRCIGDISVIGACSALPQPWWSAAGTLGDHQRERLLDMLRSAANTLRFVAMHHPPLVGMAVRRKALTDAVQLQSILDETRPEIVLHGHLHRNRATSTSMGRIICTAPASSVRRDAPASYRVFEISPAHAGWRISMTLKSRLQESMSIAAQESWVAERGAVRWVTPPDSTEQRPPRAR